MIKAKIAIAKELIEYKNDFWPEYDENDEHLDWDAVDAGEYDMTKETFEQSITLMDILIRKMIYIANTMTEMYLVAIESMLLLTMSTIY